MTTFMTTLTIHMPTNIHDRQDEGTQFTQELLTTIFKNPYHKNSYQINRVLLDEEGTVYLAHRITKEEGEYWLESYYFEDGSDKVRVIRKVLGNSINFYIPRRAVVKDYVVKLITGCFRGNLKDNELLTWSFGIKEMINMQEGSLENIIIYAISLRDHLRDFYQTSVDVRTGKTISNLKLTEDDLQHILRDTDVLEHIPLEVF